MISRPKTARDAESPTRDERILVGVDAGGKLSGQIWNGSGWSAFSINDIAAAVSDSTKWGFAVAYESQSGAAGLNAWSEGEALRSGIRTLSLSRFRAPPAAPCRQQALIPTISAMATRTSPPSTT